ncbi:MAG: helix-turn-helix transcriptional regulator [Pseudomonadota bacterium]
MLGHDEVWDAIDALAARNRLSASGLARRSGLDPTTFNKSKRYAPDGRPRWPSTESIAKILRATNTGVDEFFGRGAPSGPKPDGLAVPLLGQAHAGLEGLDISRQPVQQLPMPARIINFPDKRYESLYALTVVGDSMQPLYRDGDVLFVAPHAPVREGDRVVVKLRDKDVVVKILKWRTPDELAFHAANPDHSDVTFDAESVEWIARVIYASQ